MFSVPRENKVDLAKLEYSLKKFLKRLRLSRSLSRDRQIEHVKAAIRLFEAIEFERTKQGPVQFGQKELSFLASEISDVVHIFNHSWESLDSEKTNFLVSLKLCQQVFQTYAADAYFNKLYIDYDQ